MLFDDATDPYQENNLVGNPTHADLQNELHGKLMEELRAIGEEELRPREYYIGKWGYEIERNNINYWSFYEGEGRVQGPGMKQTRKKQD